MYQENYSAFCGGELNAKLILLNYVAVGGVGGIITCKVLQPVIPLEVK